VSSGELASVTATCQGAYASPVPGEIARALQSNGIGVRKMLFGAMSISVIVNASDREKSSQLIHDLKLTGSEA
jgi:hypothetical protein